MTTHLPSLAAALSAAVLVALPSPSPVRSVLAGGRPDSLVVDARTSLVQWKGARGTTGERAGSAHLTSGLIVIRHEMLEKGTFTVATRPAATTFTTRGAERIGPARWRVEGELAMNGTTRPLSFDANVEWAGVGHMVATTQFTVDSSIVSVTIHAQRKAPGVASRSLLSRLFD